MQTCECVCVCVVLSWSKDIIHPSLLLSPLRRYNYTHTTGVRTHTYTRKHSGVCCCLLVSNSKSERWGRTEREGWAEITFHDMVYEFVQLPRGDVCFCLASAALPFNWSVFPLEPAALSHTSALSACMYFINISPTKGNLYLCVYNWLCVCVCVGTDCDNDNTWVLSDFLFTPWSSLRSPW